MEPSRVDCISVSCIYSFYTTRICISNYINNVHFIEYSSMPRRARLHSQQYYTYFLNAALRGMHTTLMLTTLSQTYSTSGSQLFKPGPASCKLMEGGPCTLCLELDEFDREYQATLASLTKRRRDILKRINQRHDPFIQYLPLELASKVFAFCLPQQVFDSDPVEISLFWDASKGSNITPFNIVLGSICQSWRRIAWSTPDLWSTLPIRLHRWYESTRVDLTLNGLADPVRFHWTLLLRTIQQRSSRRKILVCGSL